MVFYKWEQLKLNDFKSRIDTFANRLQLALSMRGMKNAELSRQTGIDQSRICQYIHGGYEAKQPAVYAISKVLGVDPAWLMGYDVSMESAPCVNKITKTSYPKISNDDLKIVLFGSTEASDDLLEDVKKMAKVHFELSKNKKRPLKN
jgi:transcriptional regulator with XRE-family HTH domain